MVSVFVSMQCVLSALARVFSAEQVSAAGQYQHRNALILTAWRNISSLHSSCYKGRLVLLEIPN